MTLLLIGVLLASSAIAQGAPAAPTHVQLSSEQSPKPLRALEVDPLSPEFGAKCDGVTDDSVALQAALTAADTAPYRPVRLPPSVCVFRTPLMVGNRADRYCSVNIVGHSENVSVLNYGGPMDRAAITIAHCAAFRWSGFSVTQPTASTFATHGTSIGILIDGHEPNGGTLNTTITFEHLGVSGFYMGMLVGKQAAGSEVACRQCRFAWNDIGWTAGGYNALNFWFYALHLTNNKVGVKVGGPWVTEGPHVVGGSSNGQTVADFEIGNGFGRLSIQDFRAEIVKPGAKFITGTGVIGVSIRHSTIAGSRTAVVIDQPYTLELTQNEIVGLVALPRTGSLIMRQNMVQAEGVLSGAQGPLGPLWPVVMPSDLREHGVWLDLSANEYPHGRGLYPMQVRGLYTNALQIDGSINGGVRLRDRVNFAGTNQVAYTFARRVPVTTTQGSYTVTAAPNVFRSEDIGKPIRLVDATNGCGYNPNQPVIDAVSGWVRAIVSPTQVTMTVEPWTFASARCRQHPVLAGARDAIIGADQPDATYTVTVGCDANEQAWVTDKTAQGFTLHSSNPQSTATCDVMVMR